MSQREGDIRLRHMLDYSREAAALVAGRTREDLDTDRTLNLALVRLLEIVGEAASRTTDEERLQDFDVLWGIASVDLPKLVAELERPLPEGAS